MWVQQIEKKIIEEYNKFTKGLHVGKTSDYNHILDMINLLELRDYIKYPENLSRRFLR